MIEVVHQYRCMHDRFTVDPRLEQVTCADCKERPDPMQALVRLAQKETQYHELHERYAQEMQRLSERQRTKCRNCGHMTPISGR